MPPIPILFMSDSPNLPTGLARITKNLATLTSELPEFRVGVLGRGGQYSTRLPFAQYNYAESDQWGEREIEWVWHDFAGKNRGIVMTVWDLSRLGWFSRPMLDGALGDFLRSDRFEKWCYFPVDGFGIGGRLSGQLADTLKGFNRKLAYSMFAKSVAEDSIGEEV